MLRFQIAGMALAVVISFLPQPAFGQKLLRWKLAAGDKLKVQVEQKTDSTSTINNKVSSTAVELTLDTLWSIEAVENDRIKMAQTVERVRVKMRSVMANAVEYDSAAKSLPTGAVKELAAAVSPLLAEGSSILVTMSSRGEVVSAEPSAKLAELWQPKEAKTAAIAGRKWSDSTQELLKRSLVLFPEKEVQAGAEWTMEREILMPLGKVKQTTSYKYEGEVDDPHGKLDKISSSASLILSQPTKGAKVKLTKQSQSGTVLFSATEGRVVEATQTQELATETTYRESTITVAVESSIKTTISKP